MNTKRLGQLDPFNLTGCFIAGGAVLSRATKQPIADWDIYPKTIDNAINIVTELVSSGDAFVVNVSDRAITLKHNDIGDDGNRQIIQVMYFDIFPTAQDIFDKFDFTICMGAYDCDSKEYVFHEDFWADTASKTLRFNPKTSYPLNSLIRTSKYQKRGYIAGKGEMAKVAIAVAQKGMPTSWKELESQLGGTYGRSLTLQTDGVPFTIEAAYDILGNLDYTTVLTDDDKYTWIKSVHIEDIIKGEPIVIYCPDYSGNGFKINEDQTISLYVVEDELMELLDVKIVDNLNDVHHLHVVAWKHVVLENGKFVGSIRKSNNSNGVTYEAFQTTEWDRDPYLFAYIDDSPLVGHSNVYWSKIAIPVSCIKSVHGNKIQTTKIHMGDIQDRQNVSVLTSGGFSSII